MASYREIRIPAASVLTLRSTLRQEVGAQAATLALQKAGHAAGDAFFDRLEQDGAFEDTPQATFWSRLSSLFDEIGWGTVEHEDVHAGVGALLARDWFEIDPAASTPTCPFTTGVLANILGRVAGQDVAVMAVPCEGDEDGCCRFLFGAGPVLQQVYSGLRDGDRLETALATLG
jgi:predicted hydrocarbon binding protein